MSVAVLNSASVPADADDLMPVAVESLRSAQRLDFDLYLLVDGRAAPCLYRGRDVPIKPSDFDQLIARGATTLYIRSSMAAAYRQHLREHVLADPSLPLSKRYQMLAQAARAVFEDALHSRDAGALVAVSDDMGRQLTNLVSHEDVLLFDLIEVMLHDYTTYAHATRVCTYALLLAKALDIGDSDELLQIATGALLHDVGKIFVAQDIVAKNYRVSPEERDQMREHPTQGFRRLAPRADLSWGTLMMVYQHHERVDGCGYPVGLVGDEIHPWARICAIANTHDGLMRDRAAHDAAAMRQVLHGLALQAGRALDQEFTECWIATINSQPPRG